MWSKKKKNPDFSGIESFCEISVGYSKAYCIPYLMTFNHIKTENWSQKSQTETIILLKCMHSLILTQQNADICTNSFGKSGKLLVVKLFESIIVPMFKVN